MNSTLNDPDTGRPTTRHDDPLVAGQSAAETFPSADEMSAHLDTVRESRLLLNRLDRWLLDEVWDHIGSRVVDVGCGHGNIMSMLLDRELVVGTDIDEASVATVRERFLDHPHVSATVFDATREPPEELLSRRLDTVISLNALEHIDEDRLALQNMARLLPDGGSMIIIVPAHMALYGTMDASIGHFRRYTRAMMTERLEEAGAKIVRQYYLNVVGALGWWFSGSVLRRKTPPEGQLTLFNRLVPLLAWMERRIRSPFGLSLVTIAAVDR